MSSKETLTKKLQGKLPKNFKKKLGKRIKAGTRLGSQISSQIAAQVAAQVPAEFSQRLNEQAQKATRAALHTAQMAAETAHMAADTAKGGLDQVLIGLEHRGFNLKESQDIAQRVGRKVLERAEAVRAQIAASPLSPAWLREVTLKNAKAEPVVAAETAPITHMTSTAEATASEPAEFMQPEHSAPMEDESPIGVESDELDVTMKPAKKSKRATGVPKKTAKAGKASEQPLK